ncbi:MAG TPA: prephenate dehydrogenase/arogenate dehydrogenase family protein, partial [Candidatus Manganitrophaceae bacterium]|nr:prephenate dehydrogenase/arogenate dehydrogenase family protein [Candidatus Manganitrophaceae bacterium]
MLFKKMTVIGVGLIGGSLALIAKRKKLVETVVGYGTRRGNLQKAVSMGVIDRYLLTLPKAVEGADLVVLATPVGLFERIAQAIAPHLKEGAVVTDVGSVKGRLVKRLDAIFP